MTNGAFCVVELVPSIWRDTDFQKRDIEQYKTLIKDGEVRSGVVITRVGTNESDVVNRFREAENEGHRWVFITDRSSISWPT
jgi:hypothetical protein